MEPTFLTLNEILQVHKDQVHRYGGSEGIRDIGLLESAANAPESTFEGQYLHADIFEMAAAYFFHIVQNHPFIDGNKRVGAVAAVVFLTINGIKLEADEEAFEGMVRGVAEGRLDKKAVAEFLRNNTS